MIIAEYDACIYIVLSCVLSNLCWYSLREYLDCTTMLDVLFVILFAFVISFVLPSLLIFSYFFVTWNGLLPTRVSLITGGLCLAFPLFHLCRFFIMLGLAFLETPTRRKNSI